MKQDALIMAFFVLLVIAAGAGALIVVMNQDEGIPDKEIRMQAASHSYRISTPELETARASSEADYLERFSGVFDIENLNAGNCIVKARAAWHAAQEAPDNCIRREALEKYNAIMNRCEDFIQR